MVNPKGDLEVIHVPLSFKVFIRTSDGRLTLKAGFATERLAGAWVIGMSHGSETECRIFEERNGELFEATPNAVQKAAEAMKAEMDKRTE